MELKRYKHINGVWQQKETAYLRVKGFDHPDYKWNVTEKCHGCLEGRTMITMADGSKKKISQIVNNKIKGNVLGVDEDGKIIETPILNHFLNGYTEEWLKISFSRNRLNRGSSFGVIRCTPNHQFYIDGKYIEANLLTVGDFITCKRDHLYLSYIQKEILKGKMLGDGSLQSNAIQFSHKKEHESYIDYTLELLQNIAGNKQKDIISGYGTRMARARTISHHIIADVFKDWFNDGKKQIPKIQLSPISLAFWYMDDGSLQHNEKQNDRIGLATNSFNEQSIDNLLLALKKMGIIGKKIKSDGWRIRIKADESDKFFTLISPYVPECMQYKLPQRYRLGKNIFRLKHKAIYKPLLTKQKIIKIEKGKDTNFTGKYDIETESHNFFAQDILVHNSNMSFYLTTEMDEVKVAKRNGFLKSGENFYNYLSMKEANGYKIRDLWNQMLAKGYEMNELIVYGELFGGHYPHPDVENNNSVKHIQKGIWYSPNIGFYVFDIMLNGKFLPMDEVVLLCKEVDLFHAKILFEGTFDECIKYPNEFQTKIPEWLGLPLLDPDEKHVITKLVFDGFDEEGHIKHKEKEITYFGNICEGIVIKPFEDLRYEAEDRVILKSKNDVYYDVSREKKTPRNSQPELSEFALDVLEKIVVYINENRLRSVLSKIGFFTKKDFKIVFDAFKKDIYEDFNMNFDDLKNLTTEDKREIDKVVGKLCTEIWRPIFLSEAERE